MKIGPRYIGLVCYNTIHAHILSLGITDAYKIKMNPIDFEKLRIEYSELFKVDFTTVMQIGGIAVEQFDATPVNRICIVENGDEGSCGV
jgi:hypothetical protein